MSRILVVEDETLIAEFIVKGLTEAGHTVTTAADGALALGLARTEAYDLIVLDLGLPTMDGFEVLRHLRGEGRHTPVVILTARDAPADTVRGLESGAADYVTKPFHFSELLARIRLRLRPQDPATSDPVVLRHAGLSLDLRTRRVEADGRFFELTSREFGLLEVFLRHTGQVLSRVQLLEQVWGYGYDPGSNVVDVYVRSLRKKIGYDTIRTVRGAGYTLV